MGMRGTPRQDPIALHVFAASLPILSVIPLHTLCLDVPVIVLTYYSHEAKPTSVIIKFGPTLNRSRVDPIVKTRKWGQLRWGWPFSSQK